MTRVRHARGDVWMRQRAGRDAPLPDALTLRSRDTLEFQRGVPDYFGVVLVDDEDEPVPDVPLDDDEPVPLMLPDELLGLVLDELLLGLLMLPDELLGLDELLLDGVALELVSVLDDELDEAGGVAGVTVVLLLLLLGGVDAGGATTVLSFFSHPATLMPRATANALNIMILDFMGTPFMLCRGRK